MVAVAGRGEAPAPGYEDAPLIGVPGELATLTAVDGAFLALVAVHAPTTKAVELLDRDGQVVDTMAPSGGLAVLAARFPELRSGMQAAFGPRWVMIS